MAKMEIVLSEPKRIDPATYVVPPRWAVRLVSTNFGKKGRKYPSTWVGQMHHYPGMADDYPYGMDMVDHSGAYEERWRKANAAREAEDNKRVIRGNLKEEQYRFWNGAYSTTSTIATCRWCRQWAYGPTEMRAHQDKTEHTRILREVYDVARASKVRICFACGKRTNKERWGIPLCATNACYNRWRVAPIADISNALLFYARYARIKGLLKDWINEDGSEKRNTEANPKLFNWERADAY